MMETPTMATAVPINANVLGAAMGLCGVGWNHVMTATTAMMTPVVTTVPWQPAAMGSYTSVRSATMAIATMPMPVAITVSLQPVAMVSFTSALSAVTMGTVTTTIAVEITAFPLDAATALSNMG